MISLDKRHHLYSEDLAALAMRQLGEGNEGEFKKIALVAATCLGSYQSFTAPMECVGRAALDVTAEQLGLAAKYFETIGYLQSMHIRELEGEKIKSGERCCMRDMDLLCDVLRYRFSILWEGWMLYCCEVRVEPADFPAGPYQTTLDFFESLCDQSPVDDRRLTRFLHARGITGRLANSGDIFNQLLADWPVRNEHKLSIG